MAIQPDNWQLDAPGVTRVAVTGFKSLAANTDEEIWPLTVGVGANSSGKSSLIRSRRRHDTDPRSISPSC